MSIIYHYNVILLYFTILILVRALAAEVPGHLEVVCICVALCVPCAGSNNNYIDINNDNSSNSNSII